MSKDIVKPATLPGFLELLPQDQILFNEIKDVIRKTYENYGFVPIETPLIERSEILLAKGGGETEKQIYRFTKGDTDMALRFDLTVPLARYVAQHFSELTFPFRRYHIGKVYRGEKSQRGRFREFYQCDVDIIGNGKLSVIYDAEIVSIIYSAFKNLGFDNFTIRVNNRKILNGFFGSLNIEDTTEVLRAVDKLEKIGEKGVVSELSKLGLSNDTSYEILKFVKIKGTNEEKLASLKALNLTSAIFKEGIEELEKVTEYAEAFGVPPANYSIDLTIARGLDYYTGTVYETFLDDYPEIGSVCSGGRYENLAEYYTTQKLPGVGVSIGLTRLFYQLKEAGLLKEDSPITFTKVLVIPMEEKFNLNAIKVANTLRANGIVSEIHFEDVKISKKLSYANNLKIPYVIFIGEEETENNKVSLKDMKSGVQKLLELEEAVKIIQEQLAQNS
ncbi:histidine--tRNA ligase [Tepidanaerobacter syntrophicus]|uniref:histidine--tRNA ligase n=1 Tax=Tepidanaerobacter syntrophicus TaxID=224999 RepID=UPI0022EFC6D2|nr:histidine--tRNA ligase [Tepidanaerobacter syntrophicus]GLI52044.1 histidine--tRNA ligase [Tepidanaerobacter syntrophicus]